MLILLGHLNSDWTTRHRCARGGWGVLWLIQPSMSPSWVTVGTVPLSLNIRRDSLTQNHQELPAGGKPSRTSLYVLEAVVLLKAPGW